MATNDTRVVQDGSVLGIRHDKQGTQGGEKRFSIWHPNAESDTAVGLTVLCRSTAALSTLARC